MFRSECKTGQDSEKSKEHQGGAQDGDPKVRDSKTGQEREKMQESEQHQDMERKRQFGALTVMAVTVRETCEGHQCGEHPHMGGQKEWCFGGSASLVLYTVEPDLIHSHTLVLPGWPVGWTCKNRKKTFSKKKRK